MMKKEMKITMVVLFAAIFAVVILAVCARTNGNIEKSEISSVTAHADTEGNRYWLDVVGTDGEEHRVTISSRNICFGDKDEITTNEWNGLTNDVHVVLTRETADQIGLVQLDNGGVELLPLG